MDAADVRDALVPLVKGRKLILAGSPLAAYTNIVQGLTALGADRPLLVATGTGTGTLPTADDAEWVVVEVEAADIMSELRATARLIADPPPDVTEAIARYDPHREAWVMPFLVLAIPSESMAGRRIYGRRITAALPLDDKTVIDAFWDRLSATRAPSVVVPCAPDALERASHDLNEGDGAVWAADAREGFHGGSSFTRWVRTEQDATAAFTAFVPVCDRVRVMPFLEGIPCSIHGVVLPEGVATFRPVEMVTLREEGRGFRYCGGATYYDPPPSDRETMRELARRAGEQLRVEVGFRGPFTIDGVMTASGFLPTELNPRWGAGHNLLGRSIPELPMNLLLAAVIEDEPLGLTAADLERIVVPMADATRSGGGWTMVNTVISETTEHALPDGGKLTVGPGALGGFVRYEPDQSSTPKGPSLAPGVAAVMTEASGRFGLGLGALSAARDVRAEAAP